MVLTNPLTNKYLKTMDDSIFHILNQDIFFSLVAKDVYCCNVFYYNQLKTL